MKNRPPLLVALVWAVGLGFVVAASNKWLGEVEPNWTGVVLMSLVTFVLSFDAQRRRNAGLDPWISSRFSKSPEKMALVSALFMGGFLVVWGFAARQGIYESARMAAFMGVIWFLMTREDAYIKSGITKYPFRWLTMDLVFWAMAVSLPLYVGIASIVQPGTFKRDDLMSTLSVSLPILGFAVGLTWLRRKQRAKLLREAQGTP